MSRENGQLQDMQHAASLRSIGRRRFFSDVSEESKGFHLIQPDPPGEKVYLLSGGMGFWREVFVFFLNFMAPELFTES